VSRGSEVHCTRRHGCASSMGLLSGGLSGDYGSTGGWIWSTWGDLVMRESASEQRELEQPWARETQPSRGQYPPVKLSVVLRETGNWAAGHEG